jgi:membrane protease YdiL (CAAX protease family)
MVFHCGKKYSEWMKKMTKVLTDIMTAIVVTVIPTILIFLLLGVDFKIEQPQLSQFVISSWVILTLITFSLFRIERSDFSLWKSVWSRK